MVKDESSFSTVLDIMARKMRLSLKSCIVDELIMYVNRSSSPVAADHMLNLFCDMSRSLDKEERLYAVNMLIRLFEL